MTDFHCDIDGVIVRTLKKHSDYRGWLIELFRRDELKPELLPAMSYISLTAPGRSRGPHEHKEQTDYFFFTGSSSFRVYLWDNRDNSTTSGHHCHLDIDKDDLVALIIPPGVVHGYKNTGSDNGIIVNAPNRLYAGDGKSSGVDEIRYEDQADSPFKIDS